jgi:hypothetical protein
MNALAHKLEGNMKVNQDTRIALLEQSIEHMNSTLNRLEMNLSNGFSSTNKRLEEMNTRLDKFNDRLWSNFLWILSTQFTLTTLICGVMAKGFQWFS